MATNSHQSKECGSKCCITPAASWSSDFDKRWPPGPNIIALRARANTFAAGCLGMKDCLCVFFIITIEDEDNKTNFSSLHFYPQSRLYAHTVHGVGKDTGSDVN